MHWQRLVLRVRLHFYLLRCATAWVRADKDGNLVNTTDMTEEQHKAMRAYYEFIVKKYLEIVPENQQWGICQWCATDAPASSGWRPGEPVGLWDSNYYRKHTYAGFADGLSGK